MSSASARRKSSGNTLDGESDVAERVLAVDAPWKLIQKNCFTRWTNEHLKLVNKHIADLETDLSDGLRLIALVEILSGKEITQKYTRRPTFRSQKLENITLALNFLESIEGIRIVNIDSTDIVDHKLKLILGLIWTLILHYSISLPVWEDEVDSSVQKTSAARQELTPKQRLLAWIQNKVPNRPITNFTSDWNDGCAIGALIDGIAPGLCPDWEDWNTANGCANATEAMEAAEKWLDVPQLIRPEEMCNQMVDDLSMMTYLSQFPNAKLKPGAPVRPRTNRSKVRVYGSGIEPTGNKVGALASFTVETFSAGRGDLEVDVTNPDGIVEPCKVVFNNDQHLTYTCGYVPTMEGEYTIHIRFAGHDIPKSPLHVHVEQLAGDASKVTVSGPGISSASFIMAKCSTHFKVHTSGWFGAVNVAIISPDSTSQIEPHVVQESNDLWTVDYSPQVAGKHLLNVSFASSQIPGSPFPVNVMPWVDITKCQASGRGIQSTGVRVNDHALFNVNTSGAGPGDLKVTVTRPNGDDDYVDISKVDETAYECRYIPTKPGVYTVNISYGGLQIPHSPFTVNVLPVSTCRVRCFGPGLQGGVTGYPACFTVETNGDKGTLAFSIRGPSQARIDCTDNEDGSADVTYYPLTDGEYAVHVLFDGEDVSGSPFMANIQPSSGNFNPLKVVATGEGLESQVDMDQPVSFTVNTQSAGDAKLEIIIQDADFELVNFDLKQVKNGIHECTYVPRTAIRHLIFVTYGGVMVPNAPFRVQVVELPDPSKVSVHGKALNGRSITFQPTQFTIDCSDAGPGDVSVSLHDVNGKDIAVETTDNGDNTFNVEFVPHETGNMVARVYFAEVEIPGSPFQIKILPHINIDDVVVEGLQKNAFAYAKQTFTLDARSVNESRDSKVQVKITSPTGRKVDANIDALANKFYKVNYVLAEEGNHQIDVTYDKLALPSSPFHVSVCSGCDLSRVIVSGAGLSECRTNQEQCFHVDLSEAGHGRMSIFMDGPVNTDVKITENTSSNCTATYVPTVKGSYNVNILVDNEHVNGSPFLVTVKDEVNADKVKFSLSDMIRVGQTCKMNFDVTEAGEANLNIKVKGPNGTTMNASIEAISSSVFEGSFCPQVEGLWKVDMYYGDRKASSSPIMVAVRPLYEPDKVKVYGAGVLPSGGVFATLASSFTVDARDAGDAMLEITIQGSGDRRILPVINKKDETGLYEVTYTAQWVGMYTLDVTYGSQPIPQSPFHVSVSPAGLADLLKIVGGAEDTILVGQLNSITLDSSRAGKGHVTCTVTNSNGESIDVGIAEDGDNQVVIQYKVPRPDNYRVVIGFGGEVITGGDFTQQALSENDYKKHLATKKRNQEIVNAGKVSVYGKALDGRSVTFQPTQFTIDCTRSGPGDVSVSLHDVTGRDIAVETADNGNNTFNVEFVPHSTGSMVARIHFADVEIPGSPFDIKILPHFNIDNVVVEGLQKNAFAYAKQTFTLDARLVNELRDSKAQVTITSPTGQKVDADIETLANKLYKVGYVLAEEGNHQIDVTYDKLALTSSPFHVSVCNGCDLSRVIVSGTGLSDCLTNQGQCFNVDLSEAGHGHFSISVDGPVNTDVKITDRTNSCCTATYVPTVKGSYNVNVLVDNEHVIGSPFHVSVKDEVNPDKVKFSLTDNIRVGQTCKLDLDVTEAGEADLNIQVTDPDGTAHNADVESTSNEMFQCSFCPQLEGLWQVDLYYGNRKASCSPIMVAVRPLYEPDKVKVYGAGVLPSGGVLATLASSFTVDTVDAGDALLEINIQDSDGAKILPVINKKDETGLYEVTYTAQWVGMYTLDVTYGSQPIPQSPFHVSVSPAGLADQLKIISGAEDTILVGQLNSITLDSSGAGEGHVTCTVTNSNGESIDVDIAEDYDSRVVIQYKVPTPDNYRVVIGFGGEVITGGDFTQQALSESDYKDYLVNKLREEAELVTVYQPVDFCIAAGPIFNFITAIVTTPAGVKKCPEVTDQRNGTILVHYKPDETGMHQLDVLYNDQSVEGSPFKFFATPIALGRITASGSGLSHGVATTQCKFDVIIPHGAGGGLSVAIEGPSKAEIQCVENGDNTCSVSYYPRVAGLYVINIKFADHHITGSPFTANILPEGSELQLSSASVASDNGVKCLGVVEDDIEQLQASVVGPSGTSYSNCQVTTLNNGQLGVVFSPQEVGQHNVNVIHRDLGPVNGSPFKVYVRETEIGIADMVKVYGTGLAEGLAQKSCQFYIDTADAGCGALSLSVEGPSKTNIECFDVGSGKCCVTYQPMTPGVYVINVKYADQLVPGCPFLANITGQSEIEVLEKTVQDISDVSHINSECELYLKLPGTSIEDIFATVTGPSGVNQDCDVASDSPGIYHVSFMPSETGVHIINVKCKHSPVPGSPFKFTVGPINSGGAEKVLAVGQGLISASVDEPGQFIIYTREAGLGRLSVAMEGPTRCDINMQDLGDGACEVSYCCVEPGDYMLSVKFNDIHIPNSPCKVSVSSSNSDQQQISNVRKVQNVGCQINTPVSISFQAIAARDSLEAYIVAPSGAQNEGIIQELNQDQFAVRFVPRENGVHSVHVRVNNEPVIESPFRVIVGTQVGDASLVEADGYGLNNGYSGDWLKFIVNTIKAGSGALCVTVDGPSKVRLECTQVKAGYQFSYCPAVAGVYFVSIKYAGSTDIPGSPFKVIVKEKRQVTIETVGHQLSSSFMKNIKTTGYGLLRAKVNEEASFTVDAGPAASKSMLLVGVLGPSGSCQEVAVRHNRSGLYTVNYRPIETGYFTIVVKCNDQHIPGSPFCVLIE